MKLSDYQHKAIAFANPNLSPEMAIGTRGMGLAGETGELIDLIKKHLEQGHPLDLNKVKIELGDCLYYVSAIACHFDLRLEFVARVLEFASYPQIEITQNLLRLDSMAGAVNGLIEFYLFRGDRTFDPQLEKMKLCIALENVFYRLASIAHHFNLTIEQIADANIEKLNARYGDRFSVERSLNRVGEG